ncbi:MAG: hypothetical protein LBR79_03060 [Oscillospiraceae bacterium]|nr:hypothetical protein [Oscillospiraceae bacterium]
MVFSKKRNNVMFRYIKAILTGLPILNWSCLKIIEISSFSPAYRRGKKILSTNLTHHPLRHGFRKRKFIYVSAQTFEFFNFT